MWRLQGPGLSGSISNLMGTGNVPKSMVLDGTAESLGYVGECMNKYPNMTVEIGARIGELGRQPRTSRKFFDRFQDRILFGTDATATTSRSRFTTTSSTKSIFGFSRQKTSASTIQRRAQISVGTGLTALSPLDLGAVSLSPRRENPMRNRQSEIVRRRTLTSNL